MLLVGLFKPLDSEFVQNIQDWHYLCPWRPRHSALPKDKLAIHILNNPSPNSCHLLLAISTTEISPNPTSI